MPLDYDLQRLMVSQKVHLRRCASLLGFCAPSPACGGRAFYETILLMTFYEIIKIKDIDRRDIP